MEGLGLLRSIIQATGLPGEAVEREIHKLLAARGLDPDNVTMDDLRELLAAYLQEVLIEAKAQY